MTGAPLNSGVPNQREPVTQRLTGLPTRSWFYFFQTVWNRTVPVAAIIQLAGVTLPSGYLPCDGSAVSRETFSALNSVAAAARYASPWGPGDGNNTFNVPAIAPVGGVQSIIKT